MGVSDFPCWLSGRDAAIAKALIAQADFIYCGREEDFIPYDEEIGNGYHLAKCCGWQLASAHEWEESQITFTQLALPL